MFQDWIRPLISLGTLDKGGFKCIEEGGALKVFKDPKVFMEESKSIEDDLHKLYVIQPWSTNCLSTTSNEYGDGNTPYHNGNTSRMEAKAPILASPFQYTR